MIANKTCTHISIHYDIIFCIEMVKIKYCSSYEIIHNVPVPKPLIFPAIHVIIAKILHITQLLSDAHTWSCKHECWRGATSSVRYSFIDFLGPRLLFEAHTLILLPCMVLRDLGADRLRRWNNEHIATNARLAVATSLFAFCGFVWPEFQTNFNVFFEKKFVSIQILIQFNSFAIHTCCVIFGIQLRVLSGIIILYIWNNDNQGQRAQHTTSRNKADVQCTNCAVTNYSNRQRRKVFDVESSKCLKSASKLFKFAI